MRKVRSCTTLASLFLVIYILWILSPPAYANAQTLSPRPRISEQVNDNITVRISGSTPRLIKHALDMGRMDGSAIMGPLFLVLKSSPEQDQEFQTLLDQQHDRNSPNYHKWLTPDEFGAAFGLDVRDLQQITDWLAREGFTVNSVARGRRSILFNATAGQVEHAFHTEMHTYLFNGKRRFSNGTDLYIPAALVPVIDGVAALNNLSDPKLQDLSEHSNNQLRRAQQPPYTDGGGQHFISPGDFAVLYNTLPLLNGDTNGKGKIDGSGVAIAIASIAYLNTSDVEMFRKLFLPGYSFSNTTVFYLDANGNCCAPDAPTGAPNISWEREALLDVEWAGAAAPGAVVKYVSSVPQANTEVSYVSAILASSTYVIDLNIAPILSVSFQTCEQQLSNAAFNHLWQQAAGEGITVFVAATDSGSAGCDDFATEAIATQGYAVNGVASTPYNVAVGGTEFYENGNDGSYWAANADGCILGTVVISFPCTSALGYIPEETWNESGPPVGIGSGIWAGGGGVSSCYSKPSWQAGPGVPSFDPIVPSSASGCSTLTGQHRYLPDVSLAAAGQHDGYLLCASVTPGGACIGDSTGNIISHDIAGGTSAAAPAFAGIQALINQQYGRQGLATYVYYKLAALLSPPACNSTSAAGRNAACVFNDITMSGNYVPCKGGSPSCSSSDPNTPGELLNFSAGPGYDLATGLGSVNAYNLFVKWDSVSFPTALTLSVSAYSIAPNSNTTLTATVIGSRLPSSPRGSVVFHLWTQTGPTLASGTLSTKGGGTETVSITVLGSQLQSGSNNIYAVYSGDEADDAPSSAMVTIVVSSSTSKVATTTALITSATQLTQGAPITLTAKVQPQSGTGVPSGSVIFYDGTSQFGTRTLDNTGTSLLSTSSLGFGTHSITASYAGDPNFSASTSSSVSVTVVAVHPVIFVNPGTGSLGITQFQKSGSGFTPNGMITQRVTYPDTSVYTGTRTADATGGYSYPITYSNQIGPYFQTDTDNQSGQPSAKISWSVTAPVINDFVLLASPTAQSLSQSGSVGFNIQTQTTNGSSQTVTFGVSNLPTGVSATFTPTSVSSGNASNLTIAAALTAPTGTYTLTVTGASSTAAHTVQVSITVLQAASGPVMTVNPSSLRFNDQVVGTISSPQTVVLRNSGTGQLIVTGIGLVVGSTDYALNLSQFSSPLILNQGITYSVPVYFEPTTAGSRPGQIIIYDNAPGSPQIVSLTGNGLAPQPSTGTINVYGTLNGIALPDLYYYQYSLTGPTQITGYDNHSFSVPPGSYSVSFQNNPSYFTLASVTPSASQSVVAGGTTTFTLSFTAPNDFYPPYFGVPSGSSGGSPQIVPAGQNATYYAVVPYPVGNASTPITLSITGAPGGSVATFNPEPAYGSSTLIVATNLSTTPPGVYALTLNGTNSSGLTRVGATSTLAVTAPPVTLTQLVSQSSSGGQANSGAVVTTSSPMSADGRFVAFLSSSTNLTSDNTSGHQEIFIRDIQSGTTSLASVSTGGVPADFDSFGGSVSADGQYAVFDSAADNLYPGSVLGATNGIYVRDLTKGVTEREDLAPDGTPGNGTSYNAAISGNGRYVAFISTATNLISGISGAQVYLRDRNTGHTVLASTAVDGSSANGRVSGVSISADGRYVAFISAATNLVLQNTNGIAEAFVRDIATGTTDLVSMSTSGIPANFYVFDDGSPLAISADGRYVAFSSYATNLVLQPTDVFVTHSFHNFIYDRQSHQMALVDVDSVGTALSGTSFFHPAISLDGRFVAFYGFGQVLVRDTVASQSAVVSLAANGQAGNNSTWGWDIGLGGSRVAFASAATNLVSSDLNNATDVFVAANPFVGNVSLNAVSLGTSSTSGGSTVTGTVTLTGAAPIGGATVTLWTNNSAAQTLATITVAAGSTSAPFTISTSLVRVETVLTVMASYGGRSAVSILTLEPSARLSVSPTNQDFGDQAVSTNSPAATFAISNDGSGTLNGVTVALAAGQLFKITKNTCGVTLLAGNACSVSVTFSPIVAGLQADVLKIGYGTSGDSQLIPLAGNGAQPLATVAPSQADIGSHPVASTSLATVTLANNGNAPLSVVSVTITGANSGDFTTSSDTCSGTVLPPNSNCLLVLAFTPSGRGPRSAILELAVNVPSSPLQVSLTGIGTAAEAILSSNIIAFAPQLTGTVSGAKTIILTNSGNAGLSISNIAITGDFSTTNSCGTQLSVGSSCPVSITFTPAMVGQRRGTLSITDNAPGSPHVIDLSGVGDAQLLLLRPQRPARSGAEIILAGAASRIRFDVLTNAVSGRISLSCVSPTPTLKCTVEPASLDLSGSRVAVDVVVADNTARTTNPAFGPASPTGGLHRYDLQVTAMIGTSGETIAVPVAVDEPDRPEPLHSESQSSAGSLSKERVDQVEPIRFAVPGSAEAPKGRKATGLVLSEEKIAFGVVPIGTVSVAREITLKNPQSIRITIEEMKATTEFLQVNTCSPELKPSESCKVVITFKPAVMGKKEGRLTIKTSGRTMIVNLTGTAQ